MQGETLIVYFRLPTFSLQSSGWIDWSSGTLSMLSLNGAVDHGSRAVRLVTHWYGAPWLDESSLGLWPCMWCPACGNYVAGVQNQWTGRKSIRGAGVMRRTDRNFHNVFKNDLRVRPRRSS